METKYTCPHCGQHVVLDAATPGVTINCPNCRVAFALPAPSGGRRGLASPWIWCVGALLAIGITYPLLFKSAPARGKPANSTTAEISKVPAKLPTDPASAGIMIEGKSLAAWVDQLKGPDVAEGHVAQQMIKKHAGEAKPGLIRMIQDTSFPGKLRGRATEALGYVIKKTDPEIQVLVGALADRNADLRTGSLNALRRQKMDAATVVPRLIEMADSPDTGTRRTAAEYLTELGTAAADALPAVQKLAGDSDAHVKKYGAVALVRLSQPQFAIKNAQLATAVTDLGSSDPATQDRARSVIAEIGPAANPELVAVLANGQSAANERRLAAMALGFTKGGGDPEIKTLIAALKDPEILVRTSALTSLGLLQLDPKILAPLCLDILSDHDGGMRKRAAEILGKLGTDAADAIPTLKRMAAKDRNRGARSAAVSALKKLGVGETAAEAKNL